MKGSEIREKFLKYFEKKGHKRLPSSSLIPSDPSVLLTLAGMLQFKPIFLGEEKPSVPKATTCQKCIRMIDIDRVGKTPRHHTFFEMLGNFSFGDYFKKEAIEWAWEFLTEELKLDKGRLSAAVFEKDEEAYDIWTKSIGLPPDRVFKLGEENNFWAVGPTGPCGPCSEVYWDTGEKFGCGKKDCAPGCDCDRFLEVWNLVFIEFNRDAGGKLNKLPSKNIDTGMGLERIVSVLQGVPSNFETDLLKPIGDAFMKLAKFKPEKSNAAKNVVSDHVRAVSHLIADGVVPANEGRGYVLRRLIRRGVRFGRMFKIEEPFLWRLSKVVVDLNGKFYPELKKRSAEIAKIIKAEEESFSLTLDQGLSLITKLIDSHKSDTIIPGKDAFKLHDTFGFPLELTQEIAAESGLTVDIDGFNEEMKVQQERARAAGIKGGADKIDLNKYKKLPSTKFVGYESLQADAKVVFIDPQEKTVVLEKSPFYPEGGGQVGDEGSLSFNGSEVKVLATFGEIGGVIVQKVDNVAGLNQKMNVKATVNSGKRFSTAKHHTSTHLLHKALGIVLGEGANQTGSFVSPDYFRFDFSHGGALSSDERSQIEAIVNTKIKENLKVEAVETSLQDAQKMGAKALFGEKYGKKVRVLKIGDFSMELCAGTHVNNTGAIELFKISSESAVAAGVRRIEAVAGSKVIEHILQELNEVTKKNVEMICVCKSEDFKKEQLGGAPLRDFDVFEITVEEVNTIKKALRNKDLIAVDKFMSHLYERNERLMDRIDNLRRDIRNLSAEKVSNDAPLLVSKAKDISGVRVVTAKYMNVDKDSLRVLSDRVSQLLPSCVMIFGTVVSEKPVIVCSVTKDLVDKGISASDIVRLIAPVIGGGGGGKPNLAEAGGRDADKLDEAIEKGLLYTRDKLEGKSA